MDSNKEGNVKRNERHLKVEAELLRKLVSDFCASRDVGGARLWGYDHLLATKAGKLAVDVSDLSPSIFCRFESPKTAIEVSVPCFTHLNTYSGKWNFHGSDDKAATVFEEWKRAVLEILTEAPVREPLPVPVEIATLGAALACLYTAADLLARGDRIAQIETLNVRKLIDKATQTLKDKLDPESDAMGLLADVVATESDKIEKVLGIG